MCFEGENIDFTNRLKAGQRKKNRIKSNTKVVGLRMEGMSLHPTEVGNANGAAVLVEELGRR